MIQKIPGVEFVEMEKCRENSDCCGMGGGRMWMDPPKGLVSSQRIAEKCRTWRRRRIIAPSGGQDPARNGQGRRARYRQEHRRRRARLQQFRDHRSRRDGFRADIFETAKAEKVDAIGLSGLITPSLDEMCFVASEMEREGFDLPLMIGGATTSRVHTAAKIHPNYSRGQAVYVTDASRAVGIAQALISKEARGALCRADSRGICARRRGAPAVGGRQAATAARQGARQCAAGPTGSTICRRNRRLRARAFSSPPTIWANSRNYIDWTPFFQTWELKGPLSGDPRRTKSRAKPRATCSPMRRKC